ncbi:hypothetical protein FRB90_011952 [Tulasnella sp. 427]|nr:hypothetical protein FRB90_011952 [Tulasnella sp. 427]
MAPGKHDDTSISSNDVVSTSSSLATLSAATTSASPSATMSSILSAAVTTPTVTTTASPTATALPNTATPTPTVAVTATSAGPVNAGPSSPPPHTGQSSTSLKIIGGIVTALVGILIVFAIAIFYLKRRWKAQERKHSSSSSSMVFRDAKNQRDEEEGGGEGTAFIASDEKHRAGSREDSLASTRSKSSVDSYTKKSGQKRTSLGTYQSPGVAPEEAYMMFGGSTTDLNDEEEKPLTYHQRHLSESSTFSGSNNNTSNKRTSWSGGAPPPTDARARRISLLDDDSRYPVVNASTDSLGRRQMRHSVSYTPGAIDPFADKTPTSSPKPQHKSFTAGETRGAAAAAARPRLPPGAQAPGSPTPQESRRVSLKGGVGVRRQSAPGSPGSPKASPAWK